MNEIFNNFSEIEKGIYRELFKRDYYEFFKYFWPVIEAHELIEAPYLKYVCAEVSEVFKMAADWNTQIDKSYDLLLNIAPGTSKSSAISKIGAAYLWTLNPDLQLIQTSYSSAPVKEFTAKFKKILESEEFLKIYPDLALVEDNVSKQKNQYKGTRFTTSTNGSITGLHGDLVIVDDHNQPPKIERDESGTAKLTQGATLTEIISGNAWHDDKLTSRLTSKEFSRLIYVQQRVHRQDLSGYLLNKAKNGAMSLKHISLPAKLDKGIRAFSQLYVDGKVTEEVDLSYLYTNNLLDPKRLSSKVLEKQEKMMGSYAFNAQYLQKPVKDKGGLIKPKWFPTISAKQLPDNLVRYFYTDPSEGKANSDNMATCVWSLFESKIYIWEIHAVVKPFNDYIGYRNQQGKWVDKEYDLLVKRHGYSKQSKMYFEAKSSGSPYIQYINAHTPYNAMEDLPKGSKIDRVMLASPTFEAGRVILVKDVEGVSSEWIPAFLEEASNFTGKDGDPDDRVDVATAAVKLTEFNGSSFIYQEKAESQEDFDITF